MRKAGWGLLFAVCVMPERDIWNKANSPTLVGVIKAIHMEKSDIELDKGPHVTWDIATTIYSQFGGPMYVEDLKAGDEIEVWTRDCKLMKAKSIRSFVIRVHKT